VTELETKLAIVRRVLSSQALGAVRLRGVDWFSWATCGGSNVVILTTETGVAEVLITTGEAWVLTDDIEAERLRVEEVPAALTVWTGPWSDAHRRETFVRDATGSAPIASDRPGPGEQPLPEPLVEARWSLLPEEQARYRTLGSDVASSVTDVLCAARPDWTGTQLAGAAAEALSAGGVHPTLALVGDERRLPIYRHPTPSQDRLGARAMLVVCGRRHGLFANLSRFVYFRRPSAGERRMSSDVAAVEAAAFRASRPGSTLGSVYDAMVQAYAERGHAGAEAFHHQGGSCGYLSRDVIAQSTTLAKLQGANAVAWNPSLPGAKIEDTVIVGQDAVEILTVDHRWPTVEIDGRARPDLFVR